MKSTIFSRYDIRKPSLVSCFLCHISCLLSHIFFLTSSVPRLLSHASSHLPPATSSSIMSPALHLLHYVSYLLSHVFSLMYPVLRHLSHISCLKSPVARLLSLVSWLTSPVSHVPHLPQLCVLIVNNYFGRCPHSPHRLRRHRVSLVNNSADMHFFKYKMKLCYFHLLALCLSK